MLLRERALTPSSCFRGPPQPAAPTQGFSPKPLPTPCGCSGAGPLAGGPRCDPLTLVLAEHGQPTPASSLSIWHLHVWALSGHGPEPTSGAGMGIRTSGSCTKALREGLGSDREWERREPLCLRLAALPLSAGGAVPLVWSPLGGGLRGGGRRLAFPGLPPDHRQGTPADARLPCSFICQEAGGEVLRATAGHPSSASGRDRVSPQAPPCALHPGQFTAEATEPPGKAVPQVNICAA